MYEKTYERFTTPKMYTVEVVDGVIYQLISPQEKIPMGVDNSVYEQATNDQQDMIETLDELKKQRDEFKKICIDNGLWQEPKTPEQEQAEINMLLLQELKELRNESKILKDELLELKGAKPNGNKKSNRNSGNSNANTGTISSEIFEENDRGNDTGDK